MAISIGANEEKEAKEAKEAKKANKKTKRGEEKKVSKVSKVTKTRRRIDFPDEQEEDGPKKGYVRYELEREEDCPCISKVMKMSPIK